MHVKDNLVKVMRVNGVDYISLTDLASYINPNDPSGVIRNWMSTRNSFSFYSLWEELNNPDFNSVKSHGIKIDEVPYNRFTMTPNRWKKEFNAIGIIPSSGKYSKGTFAHPDILSKVPVQGDLMQGRFTDNEGSKFRQFAFGFVGVVFKDIFCDTQLQYRIPKKLKLFVILHVLMLVGIRGMSQSSFKIDLLIEGNPNYFFKFHNLLLCRSSFVKLRSNLKNELIIYLLYKKNKVPYIGMACIRDNIYYSSPKRLTR